jgi:hypothetical protein
MFDFYSYIETFNSGDDRAMVGRFWEDELEVWSGRSGQLQNLASDKASWLKFLAFAHDGVREIMRVQVLLRDGNNIFAEIDMDFHASKERPDYPFGPLEPGDFFTVKMFCLYLLRNDRIARLKMASWAPNAGISDPPARVFGPPPPIMGKVRKVF